MKSFFHRAVALGAVLLLSQSALAIPIAQDDGIETGSIDLDSSISPAAIAAGRYRIYCTTDGKADNAKKDTCSSPDHKPFCDNQGNYSCNIPLQCAGCICVGV